MIDSELCQECIMAIGNLNKVIAEFENRRIKEIQKKKQEAYEFSELKK